MWPHAKYCPKHVEEYCTSRVNLPTFPIELKTNYRLYEFEEGYDKVNYKGQELSYVQRHPINIRTSGTYKARVLPHCGLDINNSKDGSMLSDRTDFNFHEHGFKITETIYFDHERKQKKIHIPSLPTELLRFFLGDFDKLREPDGNCFIEDNGTILKPVHKKGYVVGYAIHQQLSGYNATSTRYFSDEGYYEEVVIKYTDKATETVEGTLLAGLQNDNWQNIPEQVECLIEYDCDKCKEVNTVDGKFIPYKYA